jgi:hypothetical protein
VVVGLAVDQHVQRRLRALGAAVAVHRVVAADHRADASGPRVDLRQVLRAAVRRGVTAVGERVDDNVLALGAQLQQRAEVLERRVHPAVGDETDQVHALEALERRADRRVGPELAARHGLVDARQVLLDDGAGAEVQVADLAVAHLALGQPDGGAAGLELRVRVARPEVVEDRRARQVDGVAGPGRREAPAVEDHQADRRVPRHQAAATIAANDSGSSDAPPTSAPSTSGSASSSAAFSGLTEPP